MRSNKADWVHLAPGVHETSLWSCLHDGNLCSIESDRLARTLVLLCDVQHLRKRLGDEPTLRFLVRFDGVTSARAVAMVPWPGTVPVIAAGMAVDEQRRLVDQYQSKWREESRDWNRLESSLAPASAVLGIEDATIARAEGEIGFRVGGHHSGDERWYEICVSAARVEASRSDGHPFTLQALLELGEAYWRDFEQGGK
jgi:hypothetical protein